MMRLLSYIFVFFLSINNIFAFSDSSGIQKIREIQMLGGKADSLSLAGNFESADSVYENCLIKFEEVKNLSEGDNFWGLWVEILRRRGLNLLRGGDFKNSEKYLQKSLSEGNLKLGVQHINLSYVHNSLGEWYGNMGFFSDAFKEYQLSLSISVKHYGKDNFLSGFCYNNIGILYLQTGNPNEAESYIVTALKIMIDSLGDENPKVATVINNLGNVYAETGDIEKAQSLYEKALRIRNKIFGNNHPSLAESYTNLGTVYQHLEKYNQALGYYEKALDLLLFFYGEEYPLIANCYNNMGGCYSQYALLKTGKISFRQNPATKKAWEYFRKSLRLREKIFGPAFPDNASTLQNAGTFWINCAENETVDPSYRDSVLQIADSLFILSDSVWVNGCGKENAYYGNICTQRAYLFMVKGDRKKAEELLKISFGVLAPGLFRNNSFMLKSATATIRSEELLLDALLFWAQVHED